MQNGQLTSATVLGSVVITWAQISNTQLANVLQNKTVVAELVLENCGAVTSLSPALDTLTTVTTRLVIDNLPLVSTLAMPMLQNVGSGVRLFNLRRVRTLSIPRLVNMTGTLQVENLIAMTAMQFDTLQLVNGTINLRSLQSLSGGALSTGLSNLRTVVGQLRVWYVSQGGGARQSPFVLAQLVSVGSLYIREMQSASLSMPVLTTVGSPGQSGQFFVSRMPSLRSIQMLSLTSVTGQMMFEALNIMTQLCELSRLQPSGYTYSRAIVIRSSPNLVQMPLWISQNASSSLSGVQTTTCPAVSPVVIDGPAAYQSYMQNGQLTSATVLGSVVITWAQISNTQLANVLQNKTVVAELVLENCGAVTSLSPALDTLTTVTTRLVIDNLPLVSTLAMPMLQNVGSGVRLFNLRRVRTLSIPRLVNMTGTLQVENLIAMTAMQFDTLQLVNGTINLRSLQSLSGGALSTGLSNLRTVVGQLRVWYVSQGGGARQSPFVLAQLVSVGSLYIREMQSASLSMPVLTTVGSPGQSGQFYVSRMPQMVSLSCRVLTRVTGQMTFDTLSILATLCDVWLPQLGYTSTRAVVVRSCPRLLHMDSWISTSARLTSTSLTQCSSRSPTVPATSSPTSAPVTMAPTGPRISSAPSSGPTSSNPTAAPVSLAPSSSPTSPQPTTARTTASPSRSPTGSPSPRLPFTSTSAPTTVTSQAPSMQPTVGPTLMPSIAPSNPPGSPSQAPSASTAAPSSLSVPPSQAPSPLVRSPTSNAPTMSPSFVPSFLPIFSPTTTSPTTGSASPTSQFLTGNPTQTQPTFPPTATNPTFGSAGPTSQFPTRSPTVMTTSAPVVASSSSGGGGSGSNVPIISGIIVVTALIVLALVVYKHRSNAGTATATQLKGAVAFDNPLYADGTGAGTALEASNAGDGDYMDMPAGSGIGGDGDNDVGHGGYDNFDDPAGDAMYGGYMDVGAEDEDEDV